jgi:hypothetical protein
MDLVPKTQCIQLVQELVLSKDAIELDEAYQMAAIFPQFVLPDTLETLKSRKTRPLKIPPEHDFEKLGDQKTLNQDHLHVIVQKPDTGDYL